MTKQLEHRGVAYIPTEGLTVEQDIQLRTLLSEWTGGPISTPVFTELARMIPQPIVEVVVFRKNGDTLETLLIPRPPDDIVWPGMYHNPGAAIRTSDFNREDSDALNGVFERIENGEIKSSFAYRPVFVGLHNRMSVRGPEAAQIYFAQISREPLDSISNVWYPVGELEQNEKFIQGQLTHIRMAAERFNQKGN